VPKDGQYYLILNEAIVGSWKSEKQAVKAYYEKAKELGYQSKTSMRKPDLAKESIDRYFAAYDAYWGSSHKFRKKGGKGR